MLVKKKKSYIGYNKQAKNISKFKATTGFYPAGAAVYSIYSTHTHFQSGLMCVRWETQEIFERIIERKKKNKMKLFSVLVIFSVAVSLSNGRKY